MYVMLVRMPALAPVQRRTSGAFLDELESISAIASLIFWLCLVGFWLDFWFGLFFAFSLA